MTARFTLILFDIDGTLITTGGAGRAAIERAFAGLHERPDAVRGFSFGGMTDRAIVRAGLIAIGERATDAAIDAVLAAYLVALADEMLKPRTFHLHDGVGAALERAAGKAGAVLGLGTGNVREGARIKLERVGIYERFRFGGFGSDHEERAELLRIGAERGAAIAGVTRSACRVVVVGDTPRDIEAARAIGAECVAVATGPFREAELAAFSPTFLFRSLAAPGSLAWLNP